MSVVAGARASGRSSPSSAHHVWEAEPPQPFGPGREIAPGLRWLRLGLPTRLNHVNVWLLEEDEETALIDCGPDTPEVRSFWTEWAERQPKRHHPRRLIGTHGHLDHIGASGWVSDLFGARVCLTLVEWLDSRLRGNPPPGAEEEDVAFLASHGLPVEDARGAVERRAVMRRMIGPQPRSIIRIADGDELRIGRRTFRVVTGGGHADEHASFYCEDDGILVAGDQILPRITPVIAVLGEQPEADPLSAYLASLESFESLPSETLVLPSHGSPFVGLGARVAALRAHHQGRLDVLERALERPATAYELSRILFPRAFDGEHGWLALGETIAHLHRLRTLGRAARSRDADGLFRFRGGTGTAAAVQGTSHPP